MRAFIIALVVAAVAIVAVYLVSRKHPTESPPPPQAVAPEPPPPTDAPLPPAAESDARIRTALAPASNKPQFGEWLKQTELLDRWVVVTENLSEDVSPRKQLTFLAPAKPFTVKADKIDPRSYARYDGIADVVASVDAQRFAGAVRELKPLLEAAYHRLGYPGKSFDELAQRALQRLVDAPVVEGSIKVAPKGALYKFADDKLEAQGAIEKHLLRMGPRNTKLIQAKAMEIASSLQLKVAVH
jgi:hypothetical protein